MDRPLAAQLARLSALAYEDLTTVQAALAPTTAPAPEIELIDIDDTQVYLIAWPEVSPATWPEA